MNNYVVTYYQEGMGLMDGYKQIQGNTSIEAARKFINDETKIIKRSGARNVKLCLWQGTYDKEYNLIKYTGNQVWYEVY